MVKSGTALDDSAAAIRMQTSQQYAPDATHNGQPSQSLVKFQARAVKVVASPCQLEPYGPNPPSHT